MSRDTQAPSSPTTEAGREFLEMRTPVDVPPGEAGRWQQIILRNDRWEDAVRAIEQQARDEGRREAVRYIREGLLALKSDSGVLPHGTIRLQGLLDECLGVAGLNASESPPTKSVPPRSKAALALLYDPQVVRDEDAIRRSVYGPARVGLDVERLFRAIEGIGVIENGTWVHFQREDAEKIAAAYVWDASESPPTSTRDPIHAWHEDNDERPDASESGQPPATCSRCGHRPHAKGECHARYHVTFEPGEAGDPCLCESGQPPEAT